MTDGNALNGTGTTPPAGDEPQAQPPVAAQTWAPEAAPAGSAGPDAPSWSQPPAYAPAEDWQQAAPTAAYAPIASAHDVRVPPRKRGAGRFVLPILAILLAIALAVTGAFAYVTHNDLQAARADLDSQRTALAAEKDARGSAENVNKALTACVAAMNKDLADLRTAQDEGTSLAGRMTGNGDWNAARQAYETDLVNWGTLSIQAANFLAGGDEAGYNRLVPQVNAAHDKAIADRKTLDSLQSAVDAAGTEYTSKLASLQSQLEATRGGVCKTFS